MVDCRNWKWSHKVLWLQRIVATFDLCTERSVTVPERAAITDEENNVKKRTASTPANISAAFFEFRM